MAQPVIIEAVRTPIGKRNGWLSGLRAPDILGAAQVEVVKRAGHRPGLGRAGRRRVRDPGGRAGLQRDAHGVAAGRPALRGRRHHHRLPVRLVAAGQPLRQQPDRRRRRRHGDRVRRRGHEPGARSGPTSAAGVGRAIPEDLPYDMPDQFTAAERIAKKYGISREDVDWLGLESQKKAARGGGRGPLRPRDRRRRGAHRRRGGPAGRALRREDGRDQGPGPARHDGRGPGQAEAGAARRHAHGRELVADLRRRGRRALDVRGAGQGRGLQAPGPGRGPGARRLRSLLPPRRPDRGDDQGAGQGRHDHEGHRPLRGERGLRLGRA